MVKASLQWEAFVKLVYILWSINLELKSNITKKCTASSPYRESKKNKKKIAAFFFVLIKFKSQFIKVLKAVIERVLMVMQENKK